MKQIGLVLAAIAAAMLFASFMVQPKIEEEGSALEAAGPVTLLEGAVRGRALFLAKGCTACHQHDAFDGERKQMAGGPDLSRYRPEPEFVRQWLADPEAVRPDTWMPDLDLNDSEIEALIDFLEKNSSQDGRSTNRWTPDSCPVAAAPEQPFIPPSPELSLKPDEGHFWYGTSELWTSLPYDGAWRDLPRSYSGDDPGFVQKVFWWNKDYDWKKEPQPALKVSGRRLASDAQPLLVDRATNGYHSDLGSFMLTGVGIPSGGCWEITGEYKDHSLKFVIWVES